MAVRIRLPGDESPPNLLGGIVRVRLFIDFWNFQLNWNDASAGCLCDWTKVPTTLVAESKNLLLSAGIDQPMLLEETRIYASILPSSPGDVRLKSWLTNFLDRLPSYRVFISERRLSNKPAHCKVCNTETAACPACGAPFQRSVEKGVDTSIVTDLLSLAWEGAYDLAILVSSDADFIPGVDRLQEKGIKVINATWRGNGYDLARTCWASVELDSLVPALARDRSAPRPAG